MDWQIFILGILFAVIGTLGLMILNQMKESMTETKEAVKLAGESVKELNVKVAVVIERIEYHDERIKKLEEKHDIAN